MPLIAVAATVVTLASCMKTNQSTACTNGLTLTQDRAVIDAFLQTSGQASQYQFDDQAGAYYGVSSPALIPGAGANTPSADSFVAFHFETHLLDGTLIDSATTQSGSHKLSEYAAQGYPLGVYYALTKITNGGSISIIIPSSNAYGCNTGTNLPANSQLIYTFQLKGMASSSF